jgi:FKBP-type peptidyl-prolyl cis-trans isomerase FkpA
MKRHLVPMLLVLAALACKPSADSSGPVQFQNDDQRSAYALGVMMSRNLGPFSLSDTELELFDRGLRDGLSGRKPQVTVEEWGIKIQEFMASRAKAAAAQEEAAGASFLAAAAAEPGAVKLDSGVIYRELTPGTGATPDDKDRVKVHYTGTLRDGTVFDSSVERGTPAEFALNGVIPCWTQGVAKMKVGGKSKLTCPASTAYGDRGAGPKIKPGAALAFEVELLDVTKQD